MSDHETEDKRAREIGLGQLREVEGGPIDYTETDLHGTRKRYVKPIRDGVDIERLNIVSVVSAESGEIQHLISGGTRALFRAIGTEKAFRLDVSISAEIPANRALFSTTYAVLDRGFYNTMRSTLRIGASQTAMRAVISEARDSLTARGIQVRFPAPIFYVGATSSITEPELLLPYWGDQFPTRKSTATIAPGDEVTVDWSFDVASLAVCPSTYEGEFEHRDRVDAYSQVRGDVGVFLAADRNDEIKREIRAAYDDVLAVIASLRWPLYICAISLAVIAVKMLR